MVSFKILFPATVYALVSLFSYTNLLGGDVSSTIRLNAEQDFDKATISWFGLPEKRYRVQYREELNGGEWLNLEKEPRTGANVSLSVSVGFEEASDHRFYRILKLDTEPPQILSSSPGQNGVTIHEDNGLTFSFLDETGVDPSSIRLSYKDTTYTVDHPHLNFGNGQLWFSLAEGQTWGGPETSVQLSLSASDLNGNAMEEPYNLQFRVELPGDGPKPRFNFWWQNPYWPFYFLAGLFDNSQWDNYHPNGIGMRMKLIPAGQFLMGSNIWSRRDATPTQVTITKPFHMGVFEVTQAQYQLVMGGNPSRFKGSNLPVEIVTWHNAVLFCLRLTLIEQIAGRLPPGHIYTLPTEAQWEYACRAGSVSGFSFGNDEGELSGFAWWWGSSGNKSHPVGQKKPNAWGLYDMHGNVEEWCLDWYDFD
ncbi:MAG: formylglycine-generating enzyme family protein, partial [Verrucomicrobia bacterium]|nr:formylglycine-generating enzyme family protein [Verrucomicrobiota bacterium]